MTNEEAKQQFIREAWGETTYQFMDSVMKAANNEVFYGGFKRHGEVYGNFVPEQAKSMLYGDHMQNLNGWYKPKALRGIENNNGWTRINPSGDNLPSFHYHEGHLAMKVIMDGDIAIVSQQKIEDDFYNKEHKISHYKEYNEPLPLY